MCDTRHHLPEISYHRRINLQYIGPSVNTLCPCPKREQPPPPPKHPPFPATMENRGRLQQYLLDYYKSSTFNTCEHQPLPMMQGPPMTLMIDTDADPVAVHTPIPVPIHWRDAVKAGIDQDIKLGVLEAAPIGQPVTWCHRMVVCAKKNGSLRRTVDFQPLNSHATRETHHTQYHPSIRHALSLKEKRRRYLMLGTVITVYHCTRTIAT